MKFLLAAINAKYIHSNPAIYSLRAYAGAELQQFIELAEYTINQSMQEILSDIYVRKPDIIGFSCYIWNWRMIQELLGEIPKLLPDTLLWLGGPEVTYDADRILQQYPQLTGIMVGEGEAVFRDLLEYYADVNTRGRSNPRSLHDIPGLCLPTGYTPARTLTDMTSLPFLYQDLSPFENKILYYESSRGCPFRCSYCLSSIDKRVRFRDISVVKRELQFFLDHKVKQVKFVDRTFNCNHAHTMAVWQYIQQHDNGVTNFHFEISAELLTEEEIAILNSFRPGLVQLEIGVQSVKPMTLQAIGRVTDLDKLEKAVAAIHRGGNVHQHLDLIAGLPYEDYESFRNSFNRVYRMRPQQLQLGFLKVLKGSAMWEQAKRYGICYMEQPPYEVLYTRWLSYEDVLRLKRIEEMVEIYYNSGQFAHTMSFLETAFPDPFSMYEALASFYGQNGYFTASPSRAHRYHILLAFVIECDKECQPVYRELLTYDMYLREKLKSRPDFAAELSLYKDEICTFYKVEEQDRRYLPDYREYDWKQMMKMTHLEPFAYPVWDPKQMNDMRVVKREGENLEEKARHLLLFDYRRRNLLNYEAYVQQVPVVL